MADIRLFKIGDKVEELRSTQVDLEKKLQTMIERNMERFFGVRFVDSEYQFSEGRMDSLGFDENNAPVIFEYKRAKDENVINQGLFYLNWLLDHKDSFVLLLQEKLNLKVKKDDIEWREARIVCVANDFTKFDKGAIKQFPVNISLYRYRMFGKELMYLERVDEPANVKKPSVFANCTQTTFDEKIKKVPEHIRNLCDDIENYILTFGDDVVVAQLKYYKAYKTGVNFVCLEAFNKNVILHLKIDPKSFVYEEGFSRDVTKVGHYGTGNVELTLKDSHDFEKAKPFLRQAYDEN